jgi:hypothetical protein
MAPDQTITTFVSLFFGVSALILIMFLPALLELKKPRDAGPRNITENNSNPMDLLPLQSIEREEKHRLDNEITKRIVEIIAALPNLES